LAVGANSNSQGGDFTNNDGDEDKGIFLSFSLFDPQKQKPDIHACAQLFLDLKNGFVFLFCFFPPFLSLEVHINGHLLDLPLKIFFKQPLSSLEMQIIIYSEPEGCVLRVKGHP
jgi:hypothetical protein